MGDLLRGTIVYTIVTQYNPRKNAHGSTPSTAAGQRQPQPVDGEHQLDVAALLPLLDVVPVGEVGGMRRAIEDGDAGVVDAVLSTAFTHW